MTQDALLESIIGGIKESYKVSNITEVDLSQVPFSPEKRIGQMLQSSPNLSSKEFVLSFDPIETIFLQKIITEPTLVQRVVLEKEDYLQEMMYLDFLATLMLRDQAIFQKLAVLDKRLERMNDSMGINLEICVKYVAIDYVAQLINGQKRPASKRTFEQDNIEIEIVNSNLRTISPVYLELGRIIYQMFSMQETQNKINCIKGRADMKALVFTDSNLRYINDEAEKRKVVQRLERNDFYNAALRSLYCLASEVNQRSVDNAVVKLRKKYEGKA